MEKGPAEPGQSRFTFYSCAPTYRQREHGSKAILPSCFTGSTNRFADLTCCFTVISCFVAEFNMEAHFELLISQRRRSQTLTQERTSFID